MTKPTILLVESPYYRHISDHLAQGAIEALADAGALFERVEVAGALEIPMAIKMAAQSTKNALGRSKYDGYVALGCIIRGETSHYDIVCNESAAGLSYLALHMDLIIGNGILTCENEAQALERARPDLKNKGADAVNAVLGLLDLQKRFRGQI